MNSRDRKLLNKLISKHYWANGQTLVLETLEAFQGNNQDTMFSVYLKDGPYLFDIQNYNGFQDVDLRGPFYMSNPRYRPVIIWDGVKAAMQPLYFEGYITLKKFEDITKEDIITATYYFINEILDGWGYFNIKFAEDTDEIHESKLYTPGA